MTKIVHLRPYWALFFTMVMLAIFIPQPIYAVSSILVTTLTDTVTNDGNCSLREAITAANNNIAVDNCPSGDNTAPDTIKFAISGILTLTKELPNIQASGPVLIDGGNALTISGNHATRLLTAKANSKLTLQNLVLKDGYSDAGSAVKNDGGDVILDNLEFLANQTTQFGTAAAVQNSLGTLLVQNSLFQENNADGAGAIWVASGSVRIVDSTFFSNTARYGGAIYNNGHLEVINSTLKENHAEFHGGSILNVGGTITITNTTFFANSTLENGGAISNESGPERGGIAKIINSTFVNNKAATGNSIYVLAGEQTTFYNTIVTGNQPGDNCASNFTSISDGGHNLDSGSSCSFDSTNGSQNNVDPLLLALGHYAGPTETFALSTNSPARDKAQPDYCPKTDQRGAGRFGTCDIGAYEYHGTRLVLSSSAAESFIGTQVAFTATLTWGEAGTPSGAITFRRESTDLETIPLGASSRAIFTTNATPAGSHQFTASYPGDTNFSASTSQVLEHTVKRIPTTLTIQSVTPEQSVVGQPITVTLAVTKNLALGTTPTGNVTITISGTTTTCTGTIGNSVSSCLITPTLSGVLTLQAIYQGDAQFDGSVNTAGHIVTKTATQVAIQQRPNPSALNEPVTITFTVASLAPGSGRPTGNVTITVEGQAASCVGSLQNGVGSCLLKFTSAGSFSLLGTYGGDTNYAASNGTGQQAVSDQSAVVITLAHTPDRVVIDQPTTISVTVTALGSETTPPTGVVTLQIVDSSVICQVTLQNGKGSCQLTFSIAKSYVLVVSYSGDQNYIARTTTTTLTAFRPTIFLPMVHQSP